MEPAASQALAGVLSVGLLYHLVRRSFGPVAGLLAALTLALTPISVAINRHNNLEGLLVLTVLLQLGLLCSLPKLVGCAGYS
jgi:4-amino-4-deoxy-L-arabinose transferase-like glycosyltransferase